MKKIDFTNPIMGRRWLSILNSSVRYGLLFDKEMALNKRFLGFVFSSNKYGLRGPCATSSSSVISGTSYAMGMSVDDGQNWYELSSQFENHFNIAMPVSVVEQSNVLKDFFSGERENLVFIYHPNLWVMAKQFYLSRTANKDIASFMSWKSARKDLPKLILKWLVKSIIKRLTGKLIYKTYNGKTYKIDTGYCKLSISGSEAFVVAEMSAVNALFKSFKNVTVVRVPIKEQVFFNRFEHQELKSLIMNYENNWKLFNESIDSNVTTLDLCDTRAFELKDYLSFDTHWNNRGNQVFHDILIDFLDKKSKT